MATAGWLSGYTCHQPPGGAGELCFFRQLVIYWKLSLWTRLAVLRGGVSLSAPPMKFSWRDLRKGGY